MRKPGIRLKTVGSLSIIFLMISSGFIPIISTNGFVKAQTTFSFSHTFTFKHPEFNQINIDNNSFIQLSIEDCMTVGEPGMPALPKLPVHILIPDGCRIKDIIVTSIKTKDYSDKIKERLLIPEQEETPFSNENKIKDFIINDTWYNETTPIEEQPFTSYGVNYLKGYPIETIHLHPIKYTPSQKQLLFHQKLKLSIIFTYEDAPLSTSNQFFRQENADSEHVKTFVINPEMIDTYPLADEEHGEQQTPLSNQPQENSPLSDSYTGGLCDSTDTYEYVIITSNDLSDTTGYAYNWTDLLTHRQNYDGFSTILVTVEEIDACVDYWNTTDTFNDSAAHLREFIKDAYLDWDTQYVLLGGDWQTNQGSRQKVPCRIFTDRYETYSYDTMPSDLYFSNLDGDWYYETESIWGGGKSAANDKLSELSVGRIPVWNAEMVSNAIIKIIWYDECTDSDWLATAAFLGGDLGWTSTSKQYMEEIRLGTGSWSSYTGFEEWNTAFPEYTIDTSHCYYDADYPTESDAVNAWKNAINSNDFSLISHLDHGSWSNTLSLYDGSSLSNSNFFFGTSQACLSGRYSQATNGASTFLGSWDDRGAFAMILNTGYGYGSSGSTSGASQRQHKIFWDYFYANQTTNFENWKLGLAMQYTKDTYSAYIDISSHSYSYVWYGWNLFGDPAQQLRIFSDGNIAPSISSPTPTDNSQQESINLTQLSVSIEDPNGDLMSWNIETHPDIGQASGTNTANTTISANISGLSYSTSYTWYVNITDGSLYAKDSFTFTIESDPSNLAPIIEGIVPANQSEEIDINTSNVSIQIVDPNGDTFSYTIEGTYITTSSGSNQTNGTKNASFITPLPYETTITCFVNVSDGVNTITQWFSFTTELGPDTEPPTISNISISNSSPIDTNIFLGWENISCSILDNREVFSAHINITSPNNTTTNTSLEHINGTNIWFYNTTFTITGNYSFIIHTKDINNHTNSSQTQTFSLTPNWDINNDGCCNLLDFNIISESYGSTGDNGWIREDVDNNGEVSVFDFICISEHYDESWWC